MELYQLNSFLTLSRIQNLTRAAAELCLSQSALSSQVKALEEEWGVTLFRRTPKGMDLTDQGRVLLTHAREVLDAAEELKRKARSFSHTAKASVTIGLNADPTFLRVSAINKRLAALNPELNVIFLTSQTVKTPQMLRQGVIDVGFIYGEAKEEDVTSAVVSTVEIRTVIPSDLRTTEQASSWEDVAKLPWIWVGQDCPFYEIMGEKMRARGLAPNRKVATVDEQIVKELAAAGQGVAMIREDEALPLLKEKSVQLWPEGSLTLPLSIAWLSKNGQEPGIKEVVDVVAEEWSRARGASPS